MRKKWIKLFPLLIGAVIAYCLLWYVIPQNKGGEVAAILVAAILLFFLGIKEQIDTITNSYNKWLYLFHISSC